MFEKSESLPGYSVPSTAQGNAGVTYNPGLVSQHGLNPGQLLTASGVRDALKDKRARRDAEYTMAILGAYVSSTIDHFRQAETEDVTRNANAISDRDLYARAMANMYLLNLCTALRLEAVTVVGQDVGADAVAAYYNLPDVATTRATVWPPEIADKYITIRTTFDAASSEKRTAPRDLDEAVLVVPPPEPDVSEFGLKPAKLGSKSKVIDALKDKRAYNDPNYTKAVLSTYVAHKLSTGQGSLAAPLARTKLNAIYAALVEARLASNVYGIKDIIEVVSDRYGLPNQHRARGIVAAANHADQEHKDNKAGNDKGKKSYSMFA